MRSQSQQSECIHLFSRQLNSNSTLKIDKLLEDNVVPILVGGTHYYIQSVIWDTLIDTGQKPNTHDATQAKIANKISLDSGKTV